MPDSEQWPPSKNRPRLRLVSQSRTNDFIVSFSLIRSRSIAFGIRRRRGHGSCPVEQDDNFHAAILGFVVAFGGVRAIAGQRKAIGGYALGDQVFPHCP